jgi:NAD(P)-dependent dehydrogenase (short-subunit alcohol dehydrogenase family)
MNAGAVSVTQFPEGYAAVVIGGGAGIGEATARLLAARGVEVTIVDRNGEAAELVATGIEEAGGRAHAATADVTDESALRQAFDVAVSRSGSVQAVINSAGIQGPLRGIRAHAGCQPHPGARYRPNRDSPFS